MVEKVECAESRGWGISVKWVTEQEIWWRRNNRDVDHCPTLWLFVQASVEESMSSAFNLSCR